MAEQPLFVSPVAAAEAVGEGWRLRDHSEGSKLAVYAGFEDGAGGAATAGVAFGTSAETAEGALVCGVRPGEWLVLGPQQQGSAAVGAGVTVDLTHGLAQFRLSGPAARALLAQVCSIDTGDAMLPDGAVCGASVARVAATLVRNDTGGEATYLILADRSYGGYLFEALADAGATSPLHPTSWSAAPPGTAPPN